MTKGDSSREVGYTHTPVLLHEVLQFADIKNGEMVLDATLGGAGYVKAALQSVGGRGKVMAIDADMHAVENAKTQLGRYVKAKQLVLVHGNFRDLSKIVAGKKFAPPSVIMADLGLSSYELDASGRGFTFQKDEPLDMRFDQTQDSMTAADVVNTYSEAELFKIFREFGEDKYSKLVARNIVRKRLLAPLKRTTDLVNVIADSIPRKNSSVVRDSIRRIFQALRIEVNSELESLRSFLVQGLDILSPGGRLLVVTFHSLEDRIVKQFFKDAASGCICPIGYPICKCGRLPRGVIITKKPITPSSSEQVNNPRSKSAKLRVFKKD